MATASIQLSQTTVTTNKGAVKMTITAVGTNITSAVFAIEVLPRSSDSLDPIYRFSHVCSVSELVEFPDYEPEDECYFRTDSIEMVFDIASLAERTYNAIRADVIGLVQEYNDLNALEGDPASPVIETLLYEPIDTVTQD